MPILHNSKEAFVKACLLVFVDQNYQNTSGNNVSQILRQFDQQATNENKATNIVYPILPNPNDAAIESLWTTFNSQREVPFFVFTDPQGSNEIVHLSGLQSVANLLAQVRLIN